MSVFRFVEIISCELHKSQGHHLQFPPEPDVISAIYEAKGPMWSGIEKTCWTCWRDLRIVEAKINHDFPQCFFAVVWIIPMKLQTLASGKAKVPLFFSQSIRSAMSTRLSNSDLAGLQCYNGSLINVLQFSQAEHARSLAVVQQLNLIAGPALLHRYLPSLIGKVSEGWSPHFCPISLSGTFALVCWYSPTVHSLPFKPLFAKLYAFVVTEWEASKVSFLQLPVSHLAFSSLQCLSGIISKLLLATAHCKVCRCWTSPNFKKCRPWVEVQ